VDSRQFHGQSPRERESTLVSKDEKKKGRELLIGIVIGALFDE